MSPLPILRYVASEFARQDGGADRVTCYRSEHTFFSRAYINEPHCTSAWEIDQDTATVIAEEVSGAAIVPSGLNVRYLLADRQDNVLYTANSIIHTSQRLEESGKAQQLGTIKEQN